MEELTAAVSKLKNDKASSFDHFSNEILKSLRKNFYEALLILFDQCLRNGAYFWNQSILSPIYKKGSKGDPDNYRAIAVCSCIGKLLSIMLLERLTSFRLNKASDPNNNQCGFTKGHQCNDHIFTLLTVLQKYKKSKKKVHAVFVDLRKAFDTVNRQALLFKLALEGIHGGFFNLIRSMHESSPAVVRLYQCLICSINCRISVSFGIGKGTAQGHPLSPDLFKVYFRDLSILLNVNNQSTSPDLNGIPISHLAWADDVVILALDEKSIQSQRSVLSKYCSDWGLEINFTRTKYMVMNSKKNYGIPSPLINSAPLERVSEYCYLGIIVTASGSL